MSNPITWESDAGSIGTYPAQISMSYKIQASAAAPYAITEYILLSGSIADGLSFRADGLISGSPSTVSADTTNTFVVRVKASDGTDTAFRDRTFSITVTGDATPSFITPNGSILVSSDSTWVELPIEYNNPISTNPVLIRVLTGELPPGLEINDFGLIRGYARPPVITSTKSQVTTVATTLSSTDNLITVLSTEGISVNRPVQFSGDIIGTLGSTVTATNLVAGQQYKITSIGTSNFTLVGASSNTVGTVFVATATTTGNGTVQELNSSIQINQIYYIKSVLTNSFSITNIPGGDTITLQDGSGYMNVTLPATDTGDPTKIKYTFQLELSSPNGNDTGTYNITIINQQLPISQGGLGISANSRPPAILNTRPPTYDISANFTDYGYYVLPPEGSVSPPGVTYLPTQQAYIGQFESDNFFSFHVLGFDFDGQDITYVFNSLPSWATGNNSSGWIYGIPTIPVNTVVEYNFSVTAAKQIGVNFVYSQTINFSFRVANNITGDIIWTTDSDLGVFYNAQPCYQNIVAESDVELVYEKISGTLPPTLTLSTEGELIGTIVYQPGTNYTSLNQDETFTFTIRAKASDPTLDDVITSQKTFTMTISQYFGDPTDNLYIKCMPDVNDRLVINDLLTDANIIPSSYLFRPNDQNFGKAKDVTYAHAYGINASGLDEYLAAIQENHYWRDITLGQIKTAIARDNNNNILYEVVYSTVIDNLQKYNPNYDFDYRYSESVSEIIAWPRFVDLNLGPWYTSNDDIYTSYIFNQDAVLITDYRRFDLLTQNGIPLLMNGGIPTFYTSLTPGYATVFYPNSLENMRTRVEQELGVNTNFRKLPLWMSSQQLDGNTLGYTPAWVIAYTKPVENIVTTATQTFAATNRIQCVSTSGFYVGRPVVFTGNVIGNINQNQVYYVKQIVSGTLFTITESITLDTLGNPVPGDAVTLYSESISITGTPDVPMTVTFDPVSYAKIIKQNIETDWNYTLNEIDFQIDRFSVDKVLTYDYDNYLATPTWTEYPSSTPEPVPEDSKNFYVIFPRKTILPDLPQHG